VKKEKVLRNLIGPILFILVWETITRLELVSYFALPPFSIALKTLFYLIIKGSVFLHIFHSLSRAISGLFIAIFFGVMLGVVIGLSQWGKAIASPIFEMLRPISPVALVSVGLFWFGLGSPSIIFATAWGCFFPVVLNTISGIRDVNNIYLFSAISMGADSKTIFREVVLPSALPSIITGIRISTGISLIVIIAGEMMFAAKSGLGFLLIDGYYRHEPERVYAMIIIIGLLGAFFNTVILKFQNRLLRWRKGLTL